MRFKMIHNNINVSNLEESLAFYKKALTLSEARRINGGGVIIVFLSDGVGRHLLELTWLESHPQKYNLGENEIHLAFAAEDYDAAYKLHSEMGCICYENKDMGIYFISDPDGYWLEILPEGF
jgi:lactoylglutathione lyase